MYSQKLVDGGAITPIEKKQIEIDILGFHSDSAIFCECKWKNEPIDVAEMNKLFSKAEIFRKYTNKSYIFFSKSGFTLGAKEEASKVGSVILIDLKLLFHI